MTKRELMEMIKDFDDNAVMMFIGEEQDREGFPYDREERIYKVLNANKAELVRKEYGIKRYEMK